MVLLAPSILEAFLVVIDNGNIQVIVDLYMDTRSFTFWFYAKELDQFGFVVDFSGLKPLEEKLVKHFDHTFLVNSDDPLLPEWQELHAKGGLNLRIMQNVGMESSAELVWKWANSFLLEKDEGRTCCWLAEARENENNSARFKLIPDWYTG